MNRARFVFVASLGTLIAVPAVAQQASTATESGLEEVIVTAQRREESLQDVPVSVSVLSAEALVERQISNAYDLGTAVPGLSAMRNVTNDRNQTSFSMRGQAEGFASSAPGVLAYTAEVPGFSGFLFDLENVQVLKGPQGTLFGRNTTGGAILFTPAKPSNTDQFGGYVKATLGDYDRRNVEFALDGPLIKDRLLMRLSAQRLQRDGWQKNILNGDRYDDEDRTLVRLSLLATPGEGFENYTLVQYEDIDESHGGVLHAFADLPTTPYQTELAAYLERQNARGPSKVEGDLPRVFEQSTLGVVNTTTWDINEAWSAKGIFSYKKWLSDSRYSTDWDGSSFRLLTSEKDPISRGQYAGTAEFNLKYHVGRFDVVSGLYYERQRTPLSQRMITYGSLPGSTSALAFPYVILSAGDENQQISKAGYIQGSIEGLLPNLTLTAGFRHTIDKVSAETNPVVFTDDARSFEQVSSPASAGNNRQSANTGHITAEYRFTSDVMGYLSVRRGYKRGGFNSGSTSDASRFAYDPEFVDDYELGIKSEFGVGDWHFRLNTDFFYDDYKDIQRNVFVPGVNPTQLVTNAGKAHIAGVDVDLLVVPNAWLQIPIQYSLLRSTYDEYDDAVYGDLSDSDFPNSPKHQVTVAPNVHWTLPDTWGEFSATASFYWQTKVAFDPVNKPNGHIFNGVPITDIVATGSVGEEFHRIDVRLGVNEILGTGFDVSAFVSNLTDETYPAGAFNLMGVSLFGFSSFNYAPPRMYGAEVRYRF